MFRLFWTQNENPSIPNTLITPDGEILKLDREENEGSDLFEELLQYQESSFKIFESGNLLIKKHATKGYFISSNFFEKDDSDRNMGFMFFTENTEKNLVIADLLFFSNKIRRSLTDKDLQNINEKIPYRLANEKILIIIIAIIAILTIYIIWDQKN